MASSCLDWVRNGPKMGPKWLPHGPKMAPLGPLGAPTTAILGLFGPFRAIWERVILPMGSEGEGSSNSTQYRSWRVDRYPCHHRRCCSHHNCYNQHHHVITTTMMMTMMLMATTTMMVSGGKCNKKGKILKTAFKSWTSTQLADDPTGRSRNYPQRQGGRVSFCDLYYGKWLFSNWQQLKIFQNFDFANSH